VPVYEYECSLCQFRFDRRQGFDDEPVAMCPKCQGKARRILHSNPVIFKGSGFYSTDNRTTANRATDTQPINKHSKDNRITYDSKSSPIEQARKKAQSKGK
jgi:putative FmdB family regulatory protein